MRRPVLIALLGLGLLLRVLHLGSVAALPTFDAPFGDSAIHLARASEILAGDLVPDRPFFYGSALYPWLLAGMLALPGGGGYLVCLIQCVAGILLVWILSRAASLLYGPVAGIVTAGLGALYGPFAFLEADLLGIAWALLALGLAILLCLEWLARSRGAVGAGATDALLLAGAGGALGLAALERPNLLALVPAGALWAILARRLDGTGARSREIAPGLLVLLGSCLVLAPALLVNRAASGRWSLLSTSAGINLYIGNNPRANGAFDEPWSAALPEYTARTTDLETSSLEIASRIAGRALDPWGASDLWKSRAFGFVRAHPARFLALTARKAALLCNDAEISNHQTFEFIRDVSPPLRLLPVRFGVLAPLAVLGLVLGLAERRTRAGTLLLALVAALAFASVLPFFVADRYRAPVAVPLLAAGGHGVVLLARSALRRERRGGALATALLLSLVSLALAHIPLVKPDLAHGHALLAQAWQARGELEPALRHYEAAVGADPADGVLLNNLAQVYGRLGRHAEAEAALRRAIEAAPGLALPRKNLAWELMRSGRLAEARGRLEETLRIDPSDAEAAAALAAIGGAAPVPSSPPQVNPHGAPPAPPAPPAPGR